MTTATREYLTFSLDEELYAVDITVVQEILAGVLLTPIPTAPSYVLGLINVRGTVSPVIGLREKFGLAPKDFDPRFRVVVMVSLKGKAVGLVVDAVTDVLEVNADAVEPLPNLGGKVDTALLKGVIRQGDKFAVVLDAEGVVLEPNAVVTEHAA